MDSKPSCRHLFNERRVRFGLIEKQRIRGVGIERGQGVKDSRGRVEKDRRLEKAEG